MERRRVAMRGSRGARRGAQMRQQAGEARPIDAVVSSFRSMFVWMLFLSGLDIHRRYITEVPPTDVQTQLGGYGQ